MYIVYLLNIYSSIYTSFIHSYIYSAHIYSMLFSILGIMLDFVHEKDEQDGGNGTLLQYPCLENPMDRGAW